MVSEKPISFRIESIGVESKDEIFEYKFKSRVTHVFSKANSQGKTTLIRLLIYGLGYDCPVTDKMDPKATPGRYTTRVRVTIGGVSKEIIREEKLVTFKIDGEMKPSKQSDNQEEILSQLYGLTNKDLLLNLLGTYYIDSERGWGLFNRGKVIGNIGFDIDNFLSGISGVDNGTSDERRILDEVKRGYTRLFKMVEVQQRHENYVSRLVLDEEVISIQEEINLLSSDKSILDSCRRDIEKSIETNESFFKMIDNYKLSIKHSGERIQVTSDKLEWNQSTTQMLNAEIRDITLKIKTIEGKISNLKKCLADIDFKRKVIEENNPAKINIVSNVNRKTIEAARDVIENRQNDLKNEVENTISGSKVEERLSDYIIKFAKELGVEEGMQSTDPSWVRGKKFNAETGAIGQKRVLAMRMAYLKLVEDEVGVRLPIIIDSMVQGELDNENAESMVSFLYDDFKDHQIIISTRHNVNIFSDGEKIELSSGRLMKKKVNNPLRETY